MQETSKAFFGATYVYVYYSGWDYRLYWFLNLTFFLQTLVSVFHVQVWFSLFLCRFLVHKTNSWYNFSSGLNCFVSMLFSGPWDWIGFYALICFPHICHRLLLCVELWIVIHSLIDRWLVERSSTTVPLGEKKDIGKKHVEIFPFKNDLYNFNRTTNKYWCPFLTWASKYSKPLSPPLPFLKNVLLSIEKVPWKVRI